MPLPVRWAPRAFQIDHHLGPRLGVPWYDGGLGLRRDFPEPQARVAYRDPVVHIVPHPTPPRDPSDHLQCLFGITVSSKNADVALHEHPFLPAQFHHFQSSHVDSVQPLLHTFEP